ncbi:MAG TPA: hypothetical protein VFN35_32275, partial [Ktedonobacteraceae bacterium]|nr:hypothetical protein [Ktedonobacteraceae bacterium]
MFGIDGAAGLVATGEALMGKGTRAAELASLSIVDSEQETLTDTTDLTLPPFRVTPLLRADRNAIGTNDVERLPALQSDVESEYWYDMGKNQFQYTPVKQALR